MKKYYFYSATGTGVISLQFPSVADNNGVEQDGKIYQVKLSPSAAALTTVVEGNHISEAALITALTTAYSGAKVSVEYIGSKGIYPLN
jgi:hypothetical protein